MRDKIRNFFLTNQLSRKFRNFFQSICLPLLIKAALIFATLITLAFIALKIFKPTQIDKIYKKSSFYFFHYLNLDDQEFSQVNIEGNFHVEKYQILDLLKKAQNNLRNNNSSDHNPLIKELIKQIKSQLPWVDQVTITRSMPKSLNISITEYVPIAIWQNGSDKFFTDKKGNLIPFEDLEEFRHMVILSGENANKSAKSLFNIFTINPTLSTKVYSATWVSNRRWDIRFENGLLIKLPEKNISNAWHNLIKIYNMPGSILGLKTIDLRVPSKVYLEYDDSVIKELKTL
jgi:cell division septal protein FtsQ